MLLVLSLLRLGTALPSQAPKAKPSERGDAVVAPTSRSLSGTKESTTKIFMTVTKTPDHLGLAETDTL